MGCPLASRIYPAIPMGIGGLALKMGAAVGLRPPLLQRPLPRGLPVAAAALALRAVAAAH